MKIIKLVIPIILITVLLIGCVSKSEINDFKEIAHECIENNESSFIKLFDQCEKNNIYSINAFEDKNLSEDGEIFKYNNSKYFIVFGAKEDDSNQEADLNINYEEAIEICEYLFNKYFIEHVYYFSNTGCMQAQFNEEHFDVDFYIQYYPPNAKHEEAVDEYEYYEEIKNGFYIYLWYPGF